MAANQAGNMQADTHCSLYLCTNGPSGPGSAERKQLLGELQQIGFIGNPLKAQQVQQHAGFYAGERFLDYIAYMGCSPAIRFEAGDDSSRFCHVRLHHYDQPKLIASRLQARAPLCPHCKKPVADWQQENGKIHCGHCNRRSAIGAFNWRKMAGISTLFIEVTDIFPKEAIPQQALLDKLAAIYPAKWLYFYSCRQG